MKLNPYSNSPSDVSIGVYPFILVAALLLVHYFSGALSQVSVGGIRAQRDFNSALGMTLLSGYFWLCLQLNCKNLLSTLISILVKTNQLSHLSEHREKLFSKLQLHSINSLITAIFTTVIYVFVENLLFTNVPLYQYVITVCAVLFWFLFFLFLIHSSSSVSYLIDHVMNQTDSCIDHLNSLSSLSRLSFMNATLSIGAFSLFPVFWVNKDVPLFDIMMALLFLCVAAFYLFYPVLKLRSQWGSDKSKRCDELEKLINEEESLNKLAGYEQELERLNLLSIRLFRLKDNLRLIACVSLVAISWATVLLFSFNIKG